ncbi:hypothetical protein [Jiangella alkaliphila]|uniref:Uncharacterized protein n=1 Tax=Jiangella alkaliphila TaxID=419479 RepID=A0A1H2H0Y8_9ACTN|nr:hypothetical protein [Jiangella alkaliphila]SDU25445.1 hypothetical protein SAMN04488563_0779 [Jiangella alkaliphila]
MAQKDVRKAVMITASNGVRWTRRLEGRSTGPEFLQALEDFCRTSDLSRQWNWWQEGRRDHEHDWLWQILSEWDNGAPQKSEEEAEDFAQAEMDKLDERREADRRRRADLVARSYNEDRGLQRLRLLRAESDAAFFAHVLAAPASAAQQKDAQRRVTERRTEADELRRQLGDPDQVIDRQGFLPAERREMNLRSHMDCWRHRVLRDWEKTDRRRFSALLKMPVPDPTDMCSECQAPAEWQEYDLSLRLFQQPPEPGSTAEQIARLMPGWWERCPACTAYKIEHQWGGHAALPDFDYKQWRAMLPPLVRTIFTPAEPRPKRQQQPKPQPLAVIAPGPISEVMTKLAKAQAKHPSAQLRRGKGDTWELWPT